MSTYSFSHSGIVYELEFAEVDGRWSAALYARGSEHGQVLLPPYEHVASLYSDAAMRSGYIAQAKWLVEKGLLSLEALAPVPHDDELAEAA